MLAHVLTTAASWSEQPLLTYSVPMELEGRLRPGQLVAVPYTERLVEGIVWNTRLADDEGDGLAVRPISAILDNEPALLSHQRSLAEWMAEYYITPLSRIAFKMLPPGLLQRSQVVLHLAKTEEGTPGEAGEGEAEQATSLRRHGASKGRPRPMRWTHPRGFCRKRCPGYRGNPNRLGRLSNPLTGLPSPPPIA